AGAHHSTTRRQAPPHPQPRRTQLIQLRLVPQEKTRARLRIPGHQIRRTRRLGHECHELHE
ncbi:hypothetical protein U9R90_35175, partial [Streptomyces sp. E11-3]|uniref:hypothetical protein n=1 Tax=Streptomyces sp. E11-3 TaxID=3110112 RepID=UPI00398188D2